MSSNVTESGGRNVGLVRRTQGHFARKNTAPTVLNRNICHFAPDSVPLPGNIPGYTLDHQSPDFKTYRVTSRHLPTLLIRGSTTTSLAV